jgi:PKD repeat protein
MPPPPPVITCPGDPIDLFVCEGVEACVPLEISNATEVTVNGGATWTDGQLCFTADASGANVFHVVATNECGESTCDVTINVTVTDPPLIACPNEPIGITACAGEEICVPLDITGATNVTAEGATWTDGQLCFTAGSTGPVMFHVVATNECGESTCDVTVNVIVTDPPVITCPDVPFDVSACIGAEVCVPLEITDATNVSVEGATWAAGQLCFTADATGPVMFHVIATNDCGEATCDVTINIAAGGAPIIDCPGAIIDVTACAGDEVCIPLAIDNAAEVLVEGATWADGMLCFTPNATGTLQFDILATNDCGEETCHVTVRVALTDSPVITCPDVPFEEMSCAGDEICVPLDIVGATSVTVEGATWSGGQLCFTAVATGPVMFHVAATNDCGDDVCDVTVNVTVTDPPMITCPDVPFDMTACAGDEVCVPLEIQNADEVTVNGATWASGQLCFTADQSGTYNFVVIANNQCSDDQCDVTVNVTVVDPPEITCPDIPVDVSACIGAEVCVPLDITGATTVTAEGATWANGQLCFTADATGPVMFHVVAANDCGEATCDITVNVAAGGAPTIDCPVAIIDVTACAGESVCIPLAIDNAAEVSVEGATWADGMLCFMPNATGTFQFDILATNECGEETCHVTIRVELTDPPVISCPDVPFDVSACIGAEVCVPLEIVGAEQVIVGGATWAEGQLCFEADATGPVTFNVIAANECGEVTCDVTVNVSAGGAPVITCPPGPFDHFVCVGDEICVPLEISNATNVEVEGATWSGGQLCFQATSEALMTFHVVATNDCGEDICDIEVAVRLMNPPVITCPDPMDLIFLCGPEEVCFDLPIANATTVEVDGGTWNNGALCFGAEVEGSYTLVVTATNECGTAVCEIVVEIIFLEAPVACFEAQPTGTPLEIAFANCSQGEEPLTFAWDFGDGTSSDVAEPIHTYSAPGSYQVTLVVTDACGHTHTVTHTVEVGGVTPTDRWISIFCPEPMLDGLPLNPGDVIRAYDPDTVLCGIGTVAGDGSYGFILIYADDIYTPGIDEGAEPGDEIDITVNDEAVFLDPPLIWNENGDTVRVCEFSSQTCLQFDLDAGWHLISWNVSYTDDVANMIAGFESSVDVILSFDRGGLVYVPSLAQFSTLREVDYHFGYWFRLNNPVSFEICGRRISGGDAISIYGGWNLVSYWPEEMMPVEDALSSIMDNLIVVYGFDNGTEVYEPGSIIYNSLTDLKPQFGYWVKSAASDLLTYAGFGPIAAGDGANYATGQNDVVMSSEWMSVYGRSLQVDNRPLHSGATIELVTTEGVTCGRGIYNVNLLKFTPVYGSVILDEATESLPAKGDKLSVLVNGERVYPDLEYQGNGSIVQMGRLTGNADGSPGALPDDYSLSQNYPNPFNPSTSIRFNLPVSEHVELVVYNLVGQRVATLVDGVMAIGSHEVEWNGADDSGTRVASGVYLYRLNSASFTQTKKMTLMK